MKRLIIICEGQTEQAFCKTNLQPFFESKGLLIGAALIKKSKGGMVNWNHLKHQIETHLLNDANIYVTLFIDYYGLSEKHQFPDWHNCERIRNINSRIDSLERGMLNDIDDDLQYRFVPYLQLHEFEALLFNDIDIIFKIIPPNEIVGEQELIDTFNEYDNPEMINNKRETCPSRRLERIIKGYNKIVHGDILSAAIGLERIRLKNPRFNKWIKKLEEINS